MHDWQNMINAIGDKSAKQADIAFFYAEAILHDQFSSRFTDVNMAICSRWSRSGLNRIKAMAWKLIDAWAKDAAVEKSA